MTASLAHVPPTMRPHVARVLAGEYGLPPGFELTIERPVVLDLGANVGAFTHWAKAKWPRAVVYAYEPLPENFGALALNTTELLDVELVRAAVTEGGEPMRPLYRGRNNCGEASLERGDEQSGESVLVPCISAALLPACDVMKLDLEGYERRVLATYLLATVPASWPTVVMLEWHDAAERWRIGAMLATDGYECVKDAVTSRHRGVQVWVRG